jgi:hypothetical protein
MGKQSAEILKLMAQKYGSLGSREGPRLPSSGVCAGISLMAIPAQKPSPVKIRPEGPHPPPASVTELIDFPWVQLNGDPHAPVGLADHFNRFRYPVFQVVKNPGVAAVVGEFPVRCSAGKILTVIVDNQHFDRLAIIYHWHHC